MRLPWLASPVRTAYNPGSIRGTSATGGAIRPLSALMARRVLVERDAPGKTASGDTGPEPSAARRGEARKRSHSGRLEKATRRFGRYYMQVFFNEL